MKTAIYIEDGTVQLVITPESDFERSALKSIENKPTETQIFSGAFYDCRGGWVRQTSFYHGSYSSDNTDRSLIIRTTTTAELPNPD